LTSETEVDVSGRFLQAVSYLVEWVKHIVTIGSGLMVLSAALLKDLVKDARAPMNYVVAILLVLSYILMLLAIWRCLAFIRRVASTVLTAGAVMASGVELEKLRNVLRFAQGFFLAGFVSFALLALVALSTWSFGWVSSSPPPDKPKMNIAAPAPQKK
jgi:hypothetical protein